MTRPASNLGAVVNAHEHGERATGSGPGLGAFVLHGRVLRPDSELERSSRFGDEVWRLEPALLQKQQKALSLHFATLPVPHRAVAKELCFALLSGPLPPAEHRPSIRLVRKTFCELKRFLHWLHDRSPGRRLDELTGADLLDYQRHLLVVLPGMTGRQGARAGVRMLWRWRDGLTVDGLAFDPRHLEGWGEPQGGGAVENATDRIPESVLGPLITWAMRFVDEYATDIIAADRRRLEFRDSRNRAAAVGSDVVERIERLVERYRVTGQQLPGVNGRLNIHLLASLVGCHDRSLRRNRAAVDAAVRELGVAEHSHYDSPITATLDGEPWIEAVTPDPKALNGLDRLIRNLHISCYIVIAYLSGMRDSEIKHLHRGCLRTEQDSTGVAYRWIVVSRAFKGEHDPAGVEATWVVGHPAARAITVLERLQPAGTQLLFSVLRPGPGPASIASTSVLGTTASIDQLNNFLAWINDYCAVRGRLDVVPQVNGRTWRLTTRQFRRTLAWFIARRPGGAIAGAIHYRHQAVQMFEGYAGTSDSGFRAEVESEQALARGEHLLAMIDQHDHKSLTGPAAAEAGRRLEQFGEQARFVGAVITDAHRLKRLLRRDDPAIYPGTYVTCVFNPDKALCLKRRWHDQHTGPRLSDCEPMACANVVLTPDNTTTWHNEIATIDQRLTDPPPLPPLLAARLRARRAELSGFLTRHHKEQP